MSFGLIAIDIFLRLVLIEKKIARQWTTDLSTDEEVIEPKPEVESQNKVDPETNVEKRDPSLRLAGLMQGGSSSADGPGALEPAAATPPPFKRNKYPPIFTLLKSRRLLTALWGFIVQGSQMTAFDSVIPLFVERTFHWNSIGAGLIFLSVMIPSFTAPIVGWVSDHYGPRWLCVVGFISAIPFWTLLRLVDHDSLGQKVLLCALLALIGVSLTLVMPPLMAEITYVVEAKERECPGRFGPTGAYAQAYGLFVTAFAAGTLIGPIWSGYIEDAAGWGTMSWTLGLFSIAGAVPCLIWTGGLITEVNAKSGEERAIGKTALNGTVAPATRQGDEAV
jgi:hypothetical protein